MRTIIGGIALVAAVSFAAPANADAVAERYAEIYGGAVCSTLDDYPTFNGIIGIGTVMVRDDGLSWEQAGEAIALSVDNVCPRHTALLIQFARVYGGVDDSESTV